jgi:hypothetical protein
MADREGERNWLTERGKKDKEKKKDKQRQKMRQG